MFIAALFTIAKTWKQPKCPSADEWIKKTWSVYKHTHTYTQVNIIQPLKKEGNPAICSNTDKPGGNYAKSNKPDRERQILHILTYLWHLRKKSQTHSNRIEWWLPEAGG